MTRPKISPPPALQSAVAAVDAAGPAADWILRNRRRVLVSVGVGTAALGGLGSTLALFAQGDPLAAVADNRPGAGPAFLDRDASYVGQVNGDDLGAHGVADTPAKAAAAAAVATPLYPSPLPRDPEQHLLRRATFGPAPGAAGELHAMGIDAWLDHQLDPGSLADPVCDAVLALYPSLGMSITALHAAAPPPDGTPGPMDALAQATLARQLWSRRQLFEVMVDFWANHLNITNPLEGLAESRGPYDRDVVRRYALGRFADMLLASARHPAMLRYLNNDQSDRRSVNENYGREILELHSVGINGGYTEADVRNSAYIMTGRTIGDDGTFSYQARKHKTGAVAVMGFHDPNSSAGAGLALGDAYVNYLATHPATANHLAHKLAVRFVCDSPPQSLVDRLAKTYLDAGTAILPVLRVLFRSLEFWIATGLKTRRPLENVVASARVLGVGPGSDTRGALAQLYDRISLVGQAPLAWGPPNGYPDVAVAWSSAQGMLGLWNSHRDLVSGGYRGLVYPKPEALLAAPPATTGPYLDALALRLLGHPLRPGDRAALLTFLGANDATPTKGPTLGGKIGSLAPLLLDSVHHALR